MYKKYPPRVNFVGSPHHYNCLAEILLAISSTPFSVEDGTVDPREEARNLLQKMQKYGIRYSDSHGDPASMVGFFTNEAEELIHLLLLAVGAHGIVPSENHYQALQERAPY